MFDDRTITMADLDYAFALNDLEDAKQAKKYDADKEYEKAIVDLNEKKRIADMKRESEDIAIRQRFYYDKLIELGFDENDTFQLLRDSVRGK